MTWHALECFVNFRCVEGERRKERIAVFAMAFLKLFFLGTLVASIITGDLDNCYIMVDINTDAHLVLGPNDTLVCFHILSFPDFCFDFEVKANTACFCVSTLPSFVDTAQWQITYYIGISLSFESFFILLRRCLLGNFSGWYDPSRTNQKLTCSAYDGGALVKGCS